MKYTNNTDISLPLAVWLVSDNYDYNDDPSVISATTVLKPIKQIILASRIKQVDSVDISGLVASRMGSAIHDALEQAWKQPREALKALGYSDNVIDRVKVNPTREELTEDSLAIYMEQRSVRSINGYNISGKFDLIFDGQLMDYKSTGTFTYLNQTNAEKYVLQGSIYRWLNQDIVTEDYMTIHYIFTDWSALKAKQDKDYPQSRLLSQTYKLMSIQQTELFLKDITNKIKKYINSPEEDIPECTMKDLWADESTFAYYKNPNATRSTKNFKTYYEAHEKLVKDGSVGLVIERKGEIKACRYCSAVGICNQAKNYIEEGRLFI